MQKEKVYRCRQCNCQLIVGDNWLQSRADTHQFVCNDCNKKYREEFKRRKEERSRLETTREERDALKTRPTHKSPTLEGRYTGGGNMPRMPDLRPSVDGGIEFRTLEYNIPRKHCKLVTHELPHTSLDRKQELLTELLAIPPQELGKHISCKILELKSDLELYEFMKKYLIS